MAEPIEETIDEFFALGTELHRLDRFHTHRRAHLTGPFRVVAAHAAPRTRVSAGAVPFRPHRGIYVTVDEPAAGVPSADDRALIDVPGVAGLWRFSTVAGLTSRRWSAGQRQISVCWLDDDPLEVAARIEPVLAIRPAPPEPVSPGSVSPGSVSPGPVSRVTFAGPFETIIPWQWDWFDAR
jgi:hypothetical protein